MSGFESVVEEAAIAWLTDLGVPVTAALAARNPPLVIGPRRPRRATRTPRADLTRRVFERDPPACSPAPPAGCGKPMTRLAVVQPGASRRDPPDPPAQKSGKFTRVSAPPVKSA